MFYHVKITYDAGDHFWWNMPRDSIAETILSPFINGQVVPITQRGHKSLLNLKTVTSLRVYKTEHSLMSEETGVAPKMLRSGELEENECTSELIDETREIQASAQSTSLLQKAFAIQKKQVFVVMKFGDKYLDSAYDGAIKPIVKEFGLTPLRIDEVQDSGRITDQVLQAIASSKYIISDLTGERPNCYYETGFAHALGKKIILTIKKDDHIHFDLAEYRFIQWETEADLRRLLRERFISLEADKSA
jgi:nucleoside 2-deoxyribosyltransferase